MKYKKERKENKWNLDCTESVPYGSYGSSKDEADRFEGEEDLYCSRKNVVVERYNRRFTFDPREDYIDYIEERRAIEGPAFCF